MSSDESKNKNIRRKEKVKVLLLDTEKLVYSVSLILVSIFQANFYIRLWRLGMYKIYTHNLYTT